MHDTYEIGVPRAPLHRQVRGGGISDPDSVTYGTAMDVPKIGILLLVGWLLIGLPARGEGSTAPAVWKDAVGEGFRKGAWHAGVALGYGFGTTLGSGGLHDLLLGTAHLGRTVGGVMGRDRW